MPPTDGEPHFCFFDPDSQLEFAWDGKAATITVSRDDDVVDTFQVVPRTGIANATAERWMEWFKLVCCNYVRLKVTPEVTS